jgi:acetoin utilization deacetylase AcuC-like enzyme
LADRVDYGQPLIAELLKWPASRCIDPARLPSGLQHHRIGPFALPGGTTGGEYLDLIAKFLPNALDAFRPDLVIYNAGSDPFVHDPLAGLRLTKSDLTDRDLMVFTLVRERSIPVVMVR